MTGLTPFSIETENSHKFKRSLNKLVKVHGRSFVERVDQILENLIDNPYPRNSYQEPLPKKIKLPEGSTFQKLKFTVAKGASGKIRLMYLVIKSKSVIKPAWIYSHQQYDKRPPDQELRNVLRELF
ncbi:MAG: hypothetical protein F6K26_55665 [Moorea sp. SIO2I5]|nr:hypothetical protein [Moorena sp. SIO2I5]